MPIARKPSAATPDPGKPPSARDWLRRTALRRVWLPEPVYRALPWLYVAQGGACLGGALYLPDSLWLVPFGVLAGTGSLHAAIRVRLARRGSTPDSVAKDDRASPASGGFGPGAVAPD